MTLSVAFGSYFVSTGAWASFSLFMTALIREYHWSRADIALAASISTFVSGLSTVILGHLSDRFGPRLIMSAATVAMGLAFLGLAWASELWHFYILYGLVVGGSNTALGGSPVSALVMRWFQRKRGLALGLAQSGFSGGQLLLVPLVAFIILGPGWREAFLFLGALTLMWLPVVWLLTRNRPEDVGLTFDGRRAEAPASGPSPGRGPLPGPDTPLSCAARTRPFWLLVATFGVCGFTAHMVTAHFAVHAVDRGLSLATAGIALSLMGGMNVVGTLLGGAISDHVGRRRPLALFYLTRALGLFLLLNAHDLWSLYLAAALIGLGYRATGPLTSGLCGDIFGLRSVGVIFGLVLMTHQIMGGISSYMAGWVSDATGSYTPAFLTGVALLLVAGSLALLIRDEPRELVPVPALESSGRGP